MFDHVVREVHKLEPHLFVPVHGGIEVEIIDVDCHVAGVLGGDGAVMMQPDGEQGDGGRATISGKDDAVPPHCPAFPGLVIFFWSVAHRDASIRDIPPAVGWDVFLVDEENCIGTFDLSRHTLSEASEFVAV